MLWDRRWETTRETLVDRFTVPAALRLQNSGKPFITDDGLYVIDMRFVSIEDPERLQAQIRTTVGVAEVGLFIGLTVRAIVGDENGEVRYREAAG